MIRINLLPPQEAQRAAGRRRDLALGVGALVVVGVFIVGWDAVQWWRVHATQRAYDRTLQENHDIAGPYKDVMALIQQKRELGDKLRVIERLEAKKVGPVRILADLASATPPKLWLTEFADTGGTLKLTGLGVDEHTVADFMRRLASLPFFQDVDLNETSQVAQQGAKVQKFVIQTRLDYAATAPGAYTAAASKPKGKP